MFRGPQYQASDLGGIQKLKILNPIRQHTHQGHMTFAGGPKSGNQGPAKTGGLSEVMLDGSPSLLLAPGCLKWALLASQDVVMFICAALPRFQDSEDQAMHVRE